jgi:hypothetical protein
MFPYLNTPHPLKKEEKMKIDRWNLFGALAFAGVLGWSGAVFAADDYATWQNFRNVLMNTAASGANVATDQTGFPVLVRLASGNFPTGAKTDGTDIRFAASNGTHIPYQIERWDNANSLAEIWVKADVLGNNSTQYIVMYWGKVDAADSSSGSAVFDTANGFAGVWHLGEAGNIDPQGYKDATYNGNHGTGSQTAGIEAASVIGIGQNLTGTGATGIGTPGTGLGCYIKIPDQVINLPAGTVSIWAQTSDVWPTGTVCADAFGSWNTGTSRLFFGLEAGGKLRTMFGAKSNFVSTPAYVFAFSTFYHFTISWSGATTQIAKIYVNDTLRGTSAAQAMVAPTQINIGTFGAGYSDPWKGLVDECRVDKVQRSDDWIKLCYESQKTGSSWITFQSTSAKAFASRMLPGVFGMRLNSPNRFTEFTAIRYNLPENAKVDLAIYNLQGGLVKRLVSAERKDAGSYDVMWDGRNELNRTVANGSYICRISTPGFVAAKVLILSR